MRKLKALLPLIMVASLVLLAAIPIAALAIQIDIPIVSTLLPGTEIDLPDISIGTTQAPDAEIVIPDIPIVSTIIPEVVIELPDISIGSTPAPSAPTSAPNIDIVIPNIPIVSTIIPDVEIDLPDISIGGGDDTNIDIKLPDISIGGGSTSQTQKPGTPAVPTAAPTAKPGTPSVPTAKPGTPSVPTAKPGTPSVPTAKPGTPSVPTAKPGTDGSGTAPSPAGNIPGLPSGTARPGTQIIVLPGRSGLSVTIPKFPMPNSSGGGHIITSKGLPFLSFRDDLTLQPWMFTPMDLSQDGEHHIPLIADGAWVVGEAKVSVQSGQVSVSYLLINGVTVDAGNEFFTFLPNIAAVTTVDPAALSAVKLQFGAAYSVDTLLNGDTKVLLYINNPASFQTGLSGLGSFSFEDTEYLTWLAELFALMD